MIEKFLVRVKYGAWNRWRDEHPDDAINLDGVNLDGMILTGINLSRASLRDALHAPEVNDRDVPDRESRTSAPSPIGRT